ncbi:MAG: hypothetical protein ACOC0U_04505, partial [Desulfovibrionales bacterium]
MQASSCFAVGSRGTSSRCQLLCPKGAYPAFLFPYHFFSNFTFPLERNAGTFLLFALNPIVKEREERIDGHESFFLPSIVLLLFSLSWFLENRMRTFQGSF